MGKPKKCDYRPNPYISYSTPAQSSTTSTTQPPIDYSSYIQIPISGSTCPTTTTTTTTTTSTTLPPFDSDYPCASYSFLPSDTNGAVITFAPCDNNNSVNQVVLGVIQRLDFCVERSAPVSILSGNGRLVYNGGCDRFVNIVETTTTTTTLPPISDCFNWGGYSTFFSVGNTIYGENSQNQVVASVENNIAFQLDLPNKKYGYFWSLMLPLGVGSFNIGENIIITGVFPNPNGTYVLIDQGTNILPALPDTYVYKIACYSDLETLSTPIIIENIESLYEPLVFYNDKISCEQNVNNNYDVRQRLTISIEPPQQWLNIINSGKTIYIKTLRCNFIDSYRTEDCFDFGPIIYFNQNNYFTQESIRIFLNYSIFRPLYYDNVLTGYTKFGNECDLISTSEFIYKFQAYVLDGTYLPSNIVESNTYTSA
jgi:hypothetical protein